MTEVVAIGECMVELSLEGGSAAAIGYAGDTFNTAVYMGRMAVPVGYATAIGKDDPFSAGVLSLMREAGVTTDLVVQAEGRLPGLYAIQRDGAGERSFYYWRGEAPARDYMTLIDRERLEAALCGAELVYLSAISLAILGERGRNALIDLLTTAAAAGAAVALDTNYRARLWPNAAMAREAVETVAQVARYISTSEQDLSDLGIDASVIGGRWGQNGAEIIGRTKSREIDVISAGKLWRFEPEAPVAVVDTTGAGDAFNAAYLAARLRGEEVEAAVVAARRLAGVVVQHRGAIIPKSAMPAF